MPSQVVTVRVQGCYWTGTGWFYEVEMTKVINLAGAMPVTGTISQTELEYDSTRAAIPASDIPQGKSGLVHIWGRNDMATSQKMGIAWTLTDPDGVTRESYSTWEAGTTSPGQAHEFIGGRFSLDKSGTWVINVLLYMNPSSPTVVNSYYGTLCSVISTNPVCTEFQIADYVKV
jgi:hypothetical protein